MDIILILNIQVSLTQVIYIRTRANKQNNTKMRILSGDVEVSGEMFPSLNTDKGLIYFKLIRCVLVTQ